jgi:gas vesicle protein
MMFPFGLAVGFVAGAATAAILAPQVAQQARPVAKAALKAALTAMHEAQVRGAEVVEAAEDLYAEAKAEVTEEAAQAATATPETADQKAAPETDEPPSAAA